MNSSLILLGAWFAVVLSVSGFGYWVCVRVNDSVRNSLVAAEHAMDAAQDAHRCVTIMRDWWSEAVLIDPEPATEPFSPPTVPEAEAIARIDDVELAEAMAHIEDGFRDYMRRPSPVKRSAV